MCTGTILTGLAYWRVSSALQYRHFLTLASLPYPLPATPRPLFVLLAPPPSHAIYIYIFPAQNQTTDWFKAGKGPDPKVASMDRGLDSYWSKANTPKTNGDAAAGDKMESDEAEAGAPVAGVDPDI